MVSVIIPNYNHAKYLEERIQSVLNQTYKDFEVIFLDDCSTDNSLDIINKYRDNPHVSQIIVNEQNSGSPFKQWKKGLLLAKGEIIWIAESDDTCETTFLEKLLKTQQENNAVLVFCHSIVINELGVIEENSWQDILSNSFTIEGKEFIDQYLINRNIIQNTSSVIFNKNATTKALRQPFMELKSAGDWIFWIYIALEGSISYVNDSLNYYRQYSNNTTFRSIANGTTEKEHQFIFNHLLINGIINEQMYSSHRKKRIYQVGLLCPPKVQKNTFRIWSVTPYEFIRMKIHFLKMKTLHFLKTK